MKPREIEFKPHREMNETADAWHAFVRRVELNEHLKKIDNAILQAMYPIYLSDEATTKWLKDVKHA